MAMGKPRLAFILCVGILQLVTYTNGEVTPPWITLLGCLDADIGSQIIPLSNNSPTNCFKECKTFSFVGIQGSNCICSTVFRNKDDVKNAAFKTFNQCRNEGNRFTSLYAKVFSLPNTINQDADYGNVYANISSSSSYELHASKESSEKYGFICYDPLQQCTYRSSLIDHMSPTLAQSQCNLVSSFDFDSCVNKPSTQKGVFWIGIYRDAPDFTTTSTLSTKISALTSSSTTTTSQWTTDTPSPLTTDTPIPLTTDTTDTPSTTLLKVESITPTTSPFPTENKVSKANPDSTWKIIGAAFIAISVALLIAIIAGFVAFLRKKKENQISHTDPEKIEPARPSSQDHRGDHAPRDGDTEHLETDKRSQNSSPLRIELHPEIEGNPVFEEHAKHITPSQVEQSDQKLQNPEIPNKGRRHRRSHHRHEKDVDELPDTVKGDIPDIREKKRKHRKTHHREQADANNLSDTAMEQGQERHRKRRKHRKSHINADTDVTNLSDTALEHSLLDNLEDDNRKKKERRKSKKRKHKHADTIEESDGINAS